MQQTAIATQRRRARISASCIRVAAVSARCLRIAGVLLMLLLGANAFAQGTTARLDEYARDVWTSRNGLPHNTLRDIAQTPEGHLWFATWEGVARYNGLDFTVFDRGSTPALPDNGIGALYVDQGGTLWLGDSRGNVASFDTHGHWQQWTPPPDQAPAVIIEAMQKDSQGRLWLMYEGQGLGRLDPDGRFSHFLPPPHMRSAANHTHMAVDAQNRVWLGTFDGLAFLDTDGQIKPAPAAFDLPDGLAWPYLARDGTFWVVAPERLYRMQGDQLVLVHRLPGVGQLTAMLQDSRGDLWLGTENNGLWRVGAHGAEQLASDNALLDYRVVSLLEDAEGSIWVGMNGGLLRLRETLFTSYTHAQGMSGDFVRTVLEDEQGSLWIGSSSGLDRMHRDGRLLPVALHGGNKAPSVLSLASGRGGDMWVGTRGEGVFKVAANGSVAHYRPGREVPRSNYRALAVDDRGHTWLGSSHGVLQLAEGRAVRLALVGAPESVVLALKWFNRALWIGTTTGAWRMQDGRIERLDIAGTSGARAVYGFSPVGDAVWITTDRGLLRYRHGEFAGVSLHHGLPMDTVFELLPDQLGNAWLSSNRGVWRTSIDALDAVADGRLQRLSGEMYREIDGLVSAQANGSSGPAAARRRDGSIWVATAGGVVRVDPATLERFLARTPPRPVVEMVRIDGKAINWRNSSASRVPGRQRLTISYVGLSYLMPERIRYRTRLEGLDADWIERDGLRSVEYVGLPPGDYVLHVSAAHPDGRWSEGEPLWKFSVQPMWWQRASVRVAGMLLALLALFGLYRYLLQRYRQRNARLVTLVDERTRDLQLQAENLLQANREKTRLAERLHQQAEEFERQAREDVLTGLPNRRAFDEVLSRDFARSRRAGHPLSLVMLDLDHFKRVNDTWSHAIGDKVLRDVADLLRASCRESDLPARLGGEEFALVLYDTQLEDALLICERLRSLFHAHPCWAEVEALRVTFSAGVVQRTDGDTSPVQLIERADRALYQAKAEGRDRFCVG